MYEIIDGINNRDYHNHKVISQHDGNICLKIFGNLITKESPKSNDYSHENFLTSALIDVRAFDIWEK